MRRDAIISPFEATFLSTPAGAHESELTSFSTTTMHLQEIILCSTAPSSSNTGPGTISMHDIQTGTTLASFKQTSASLNCTAVSQTASGEGGFMLAAQPDKSIMNVYSFQKVRDTPSADHAISLIAL